MLFSSEKFKKYNSYLLHLKYPERSADDNWFHTCEILNRIYNNKTIIEICFDNNRVTSTPQWYEHFSLYIIDNSLVVRIQESLTIINIPLPLELPLFNKEYIKYSDLKKVRNFIMYN
tara:strand:+ start:2105 stop:2455 length:351 start_codon:yes stop_codon:yes gene_type:complete